MTRRLFLLARKKSQPDSDFVPIDPERLNAFTTAYNAFAEEVRRGRVDMRLWGTVKALWAKLLTTV